VTDEKEALAIRSIECPVPCKFLATEDPGQAFVGIFYAALDLVFGLFSELTCAMLSSLKFDAVGGAAIPRYSSAPARLVAR
jgi:hypothetical protein